VKKIALAFDDIQTLVKLPHEPEDLGCEWEDPRTIEGLLEAIRANGYEPIRLPNGPQLPARLIEINPDGVLNIVEGKMGRNRESNIPALCEMLKIPCTSADGFGHALGLDKWVTRLLAADAKVAVPKGALIREIEELENMELPYPLFVKPVYEGSSMGIRQNSKVENIERLREITRWVLTTFGPALVETYLPGDEFSVGLIGSIKNPTAFPIAKISTGDQIYDKSMKGKDAMEEEVECPARISKTLAQTLQQDARQVWRALGLRDYARFDFKCDDLGTPHFMEVNTTPGLSRYYSVYPLMAQAAELDYETLIGRLIEQALSRR
jgi:D-alanine-D-alanine ligase